VTDCDHCHGPSATLRRVGERCKACGRYVESVDEHVLPSGEVAMVPLVRVPLARVPR